MFKLFRQYYSTRVIFLFLTESLLILGCLVTAIHVSFRRDPFQVDDILHGPIFPVEALLVIATGQLCLYYNNLYDLTAVCRRSEFTIRLMQAIGAWCFLLAVTSLVYPDLLIQRGIIVLTVAFSICAIWTWRELSGRVGLVFRSQERILILGSAQVGIDLCRKLLARNDLNFKIVGFLDDNPARVGEKLVNPGIIGTINELPDVVRREKINRVILSLPDRRGRMPVQELLTLRLQGITIEDAHTLYESVAGKIALESLNPSWLIFSSGFKKFRWQLLVK